MNSLTWSKDLYEMYQKYHILENFYYDLYIESYKSSSLFKKQKFDFFKLYISFKTLCRLLVRTKNLIALNQPQIQNFFPNEDNDNDNCCLLGSEEMNFLLSYKDIKSFLDKNNFYSLIECNYDSFKKCINPFDVYN